MTGENSDLFGFKLITSLPCYLCGGNIEFALVGKKDYSNVAPQLTCWCTECDATIDQFWFMKQILAAACGFETYEFKIGDVN